MLRQYTLEILICTTECCSKVKGLFISMGISGGLCARKKVEQKLKSLWHLPLQISHLARRRLFYQFSISNQASAAIARPTCSNNGDTQGVRQRLVAVNEAIVQFRSVLGAEKWEFVSRKWSVMWIQHYSCFIWGSSSYTPRDRPWLCGEMWMSNGFFIRKCFTLLKADSCTHCIIKDLQIEIHEGFHRKDKSWFFLSYWCYYTHFYILKAVKDPVVSGVLHRSNKQFVLSTLVPSKPWRITLNLLCSSRLPHFSFN